MDDPQVSVLVQRCLAGNASSYAALVEEYQRGIYNTILRMVHDEDDAKELTQAVFVKAYEKLGSFDQRYRFFSWLYRICVNETLNFLKQRKRYDVLDEDREISGYSADGALDGHERRGLLRNALASISEHHRMVLVLRHYQDLSYEDIGYALGIPEKTVKSRLFSARRQLKDALVRLGYEP